MNVRDRQAAQHMAELESVQRIPSLTMKAQKEALERWNRRMNPEGIAFPRHGR